MLINIEIVLCKLLVEVHLKLLKCQSVSFFVRPIAFSMDLQTLVGQVDIIVAVFGVVFRGCCAQIALFVDINPEIVG